MLELIQLPYSPYCLVQSRLLAAARLKFKQVNIPCGDRSLVWKLTRQRYYQVPVLKHDRTVVFETDDRSQVIAKYLDAEFDLGLFPDEFGGVQQILWRYFEDDVEGVGFKLNDIYYQQNIPRSQWLDFIRHKERRFGRGCLEQWQARQAELLVAFNDVLQPCERMLRGKPFLLGERPLFVDFNLWGMLANFLYSGNYELPAGVPLLRDWYARMRRVALPKNA
jgi:glutathione S-transferase